MNYRLYKFFARKQYSADATIVEDLKLVDPISSIIIGIESTNSTHDNVGNCVAHLTKIEIVDGSDVLYSLSGFEADALDWYNQGGKFRKNRNWILIGNDNRRYIGINFGRYLWDKELALDPKRFTNPQIRLSLDYNAGGNTPTYVYITMWANLFDQKAISPSGFLMSKELKSWTMASTVHEYTDLPLDYPYRGIYFRPYLSGTEPNDACSNIKLSEDQDKKIPIDCPPADLIRAIAENYPKCEEDYVMAVGGNQKTIYCAPSSEVFGYANGWRADAIEQDVNLYGGGGGTLLLICTGAGINAQIRVGGYVPHSVIEIPCGLRDEPSDWWDVGRLGSLRADITGGAAAAGYLFLQQLRHY